MAIYSFWIVIKTIIAKMVIRYGYTLGEPTNYDVVIVGYNCIDGGLYQA